MVPRLDLLLSGKRGTRSRGNNYESEFVIITIDSELKEEIFAFLDEVRLSGLINMYGAAPYVEECYNVSITEARSLLREWMETFSERNDGR